MKDIKDAAITLDNYFNQRLKIYNKLKNELDNCRIADEQLYCDTLLIFLYAQLEGYVTDVLLYYLEIINCRNLSMQEVIPEICASSKCNQFDSYDEHIKNKNLSKYTGRLKFIKEINCYLESKVDLPLHLVNTKNNLKQNILTDLMLKLGFDKSRYSKIGNILDNFVETRNDIAHGNNKRTKLTIKTYENFEKIIINNIMLDLKDLIFEAIEKESYLLAR